MPVRLVAALALAVLLRSAAADACAPLAPAPDVPEPIEQLYGATNVNAALGNGGLTAGFSRCGELTVLKWPGPSYYDQLDYLSSNADDARAQPRLGALPEHGAFAGIAYRARRRGRGFTWLRDDDWRHVQRYASDDSNVLVDEATNAALGLRVTARHFILPDRDVLVNRYDVERLPGSSVRRAKLVFYANFAPTLARLPYFPVADWALDFENDFALVYDRRERALLHYLPASAQAYPHDFGALNDLLAPASGGFRHLRRDVRRFVETLDEPGVYVALGARPRDHGHQAGFDTAPGCAHQSMLAERTVELLGLPPALQPAVRALFVCEQVVSHPDGPLAACRAEHGWTWEAESAFTDAADGKLSGSPLAACQANGALARRLRFRKDRASATFDVAVGGTQAAAYAALDAARSGDVAVEEAETDAWWAAFLAPARLPDTDDPDVTAFAKRALISLRTAADAATGAIVASIATQSPYGEDWPRDGAFINHALDLAGLHDLAGRHDEFYVRVQRRTPGPWSPFFAFPPCNPAAPVYPDCIPPGTFEMNYYADPDAVVPGGPISFEIDAAGLATWTLWDHAGFLDEPSERAAYLGTVCPAIRRGASNLAACRDAATGLQCPSNEDDNLPLTQGLQGAETALLAVQTGIAAAADCGFAAAQVAGWEARATELADAIRATFLDPGPPAGFAGARAGWALWPVALVDWHDPLAASHAERLREPIERVLAREPVRTGYDAEPLLVRAKWLRALGDAAGLAEAQEQVRFFVHELTTPGTRHMGEFSLRVPADLNGDGVAPDYLPANAVPHVWEQSYLYAAAMEAFGSR